MSATQAKQLFAEANQLMNVVGEEVNRPEEDAIAHLICYNSRQSINNYLAGFLLQHGTTPATPATLDGLLEQCKSIDDRFKALDISSIHCRFDVDAEAKEHYCLEVGKVRGCYNIARQIRALVEN
jgi:hypothetical protein